MMELEALLDKLKMEALGTQLDAVCEQAAKKDLDYQAFLTEALKSEWQSRQVRGNEAQILQARFPAPQTLEAFDFNFQPGIDRKMIRELGSLAFVKRGENVVFFLGPPGMDKTHLAIALGIKAVEVGYRVLTSNKGFADWGEVLGDSRDGHDYPGPAATSCKYDQHQGRELPAQGKEKSQAARKTKTSARTEGGCHKLHRRR